VRVGSRGQARSSRRAPPGAFPAPRLGCLFLQSNLKVGSLNHSQSNSLSNDKKVFFADPLLHTVALENTPDLAANMPALIENAVGVAHAEDRPAR